jgi:hypothetical protein
MVQGREHLRFALESGKPLRVMREGVRQDLDRNQPSKICISGAVHLAHAADANSGGDLVGAEASAECERHREQAEHRDYRRSRRIARIGPVQR